MGGWGRQKPSTRGGFMRPAMSIFVHSRALLVKSHNLKIGLDW